MAVSMPCSSRVSPISSMIFQIVSFLRFEEETFVKSHSSCVGDKEEGNSVLFDIGVGG